MRRALREPVLQAVTWAYGHVRGARSGLRILMYHALGTPVEGDDTGLYNMHPSRFLGHMRHLAAMHGPRLAPVAPTSRDPRIAISFDDGYRTVLTEATPLLVELRIPFSVFVITDAVARSAAGFLSPEQVRVLGRMPGASVGTHGKTHVPLTACSNGRLRSELVDSKAYLEDLLGREVESISYPHGAVDRRVRDAAAEAGYRVGCTSRFDVNMAGRDPLLLSRIDMWAGDDLEVLGQKLRGDWDWHRWRPADKWTAG